MSSSTQALEIGDDNGTPGDEAPARRRRGQGSAQTYEYKVYLDGEGVAAVGAWEAEHADTTYFCSEHDSHPAGGEKYTTRDADCIDSEDLRFIATIEASTADRAVGFLLGDARATPPNSSRALVAKAAHEEHVDIEFVVLTPGKVTRVPKVWRQTWELA